MSFYACSSPSPSAAGKQEKKTDSWGRFVVCADATDAWKTRGERINKDNNSNDIIEKSNNTVKSKCNASSKWQQPPAIRQALSKTP